MSAVIGSLLPLIVGAALLPVWIILALFLLRGKGGALKALAFASGAMTVRLVQGVLFGYVFGAAADASGESGSNLITSTLLLVLGILMLISAFRKWRKEEDPDAPPPKWMAAVSGLSALQAFGMGALLMALAIKQWVFTLSAIAVIEQGELSHTGNVLAYLLFSCWPRSCWCWRRSPSQRWRLFRRPSCSTQSKAGWSATIGRLSSQLLRFSACGFFGRALPV